MFLKAFKEKSDKKYLNKLLSQRKVNVADSKIKSLGIILNFDELNDFNVFNALAVNLSIHVNKIKVIAYTNDTKSEQSIWNSCFSEKDFGWKRQIKNGELKTFLDTSFDMLISFYEEPILNLKMATALSNAQIKVGILQDDIRLNDITIKCKINEVELFSNELIKYLTVLNKI